MSTTPHLHNTTRLSGSEWAVRMERITKRFPGVVANHNVDLNVLSATFHAVIGENGAGKSTLLNILYGRFPTDSGRVVVGGVDVTREFHSPADAIRRGIALVSQHYALIPALTVIENLMLGAEAVHTGGLLRPQQAIDRAVALAKPLGLSDTDFRARADRLSVAAGQKVEILKALYRGARILLLDEPTATLAPQEVEALFSLLHSLAAAGTTIVFVTHKISEVMQHSDAVTVMRAGRSVASFRTEDTDAETLIREMIGSRRELPAVDAAQPASTPRLDASSYKQTNPLKKFPGGADRSIDPEPDSRAESALPALHIVGLRITRGHQRGALIGPIDLSLQPAEILGVAGVDGSGQRELAEAIVGLRRAVGGQIQLFGQDVTTASVRSRAACGIAYIPEDRHRSGMVMDFTLSENYLLGHETNRVWGGGMLLAPRLVSERARTMLRRYDVRVGDRGANALARTLSGGNQQKVVVARAVDSGPKLLVACQPTRGLDVSATRFVYDTLRQVQATGAAVLLFSLDLDEILEMSDRIAVLFDGSIAGFLDRSDATPETVGALMTGAGAPPERANG